MSCEVPGEARDVGGPAAGDAWRGLTAAKVVPLSTEKRPPLLIVSKGSVIDFEGDAIVNAANTSCQGGGGIDGVICRVGGPNLEKARRELPVLPGKRSDRCKTGDAVITIGGKLKAKWCIHAVGPVYGWGDTLDECDALVRSAYRASLRCAEQKGLETVAFSLISAGIFKGPQSLDKVLKAGIAGIVDGVYAGLREVHVVGFTDEELQTLLAITAHPLPEKLSVNPVLSKEGLEGFVPGQKVRIAGLASKPELNGQIGVLKEFFPEKARWKVVIDGVVDGSSLSLKEANIEDLESARDAHRGIDAIAEDGEADEEDKS